MWAALAVNRGSHHAAHVDRPWQKSRLLCYAAKMTKQGLEILLERVATWPEEAQDELIQSMANIEKKHLGVYRLNDEERSAVRRGLQEMRENKLASEEAVAAVFARYRA